MPQLRLSAGRRATREHRTVIVHPTTIVSLLLQANCRATLLSVWLSGQGTDTQQTVGRIVGGLLHRIFPANKLKSFSALSLTCEARILDVGCGGGVLLCTLNRIGFKRLLGIDLYTRGDIELTEDLVIRKASIQDLHGVFDLIMFHHSFEHMPDQLGTLRSAFRLLSQDGVCLVRIPTVSSHAWDKYRENWVQLDAPRHLFIHSRKSISLLAEQVGFRVENVIDDSTEFQFWGSELYKKGIPLQEFIIQKKRIKKCFTKKQIAEFKRKAKKLNREGEGDQAAFYLRKM